VAEIVSFFHRWTPGRSAGEAAPRP